MKILVLMALLGIAGCTLQPTQATDIKYLRDPRIGLCFAFDYSGSSGTGHNLTWVPCEPLIGKVTITDLHE